MSGHQSTPARLIYAALALTVLLTAAGLRSYRFNDWPPGLSHDEAINAVDAYRLAETGVIPFYLRDGRPEPLYRVLVMLTVGFIGPTRFGARIASLYLGVLSVAAALRAGRHLAPFSPPCSDSDTFLIPPSPQPRSGVWKRGSGGEGRIVASLLAGGTLAILVGHIQLSRVLYRGILLPFALLMFFDAFVVAWTRRRRADFLAAGAWLGASLLSYTSGFAAIPAAGVGLLHQAVISLTSRWTSLPSLRDSPSPYTSESPIREAVGSTGRSTLRYTERGSGGEVFWRGLLWFALAFLIAASPLIALRIIQPELYSRAADVQGRQAVSLAELARARWPYLTRTWETLYLDGDINPQYNVAQTALLHIRPLYWLLLIGIGACLLRWRRLASWLALSLLFFMLLPVALADEIPHGLRISGEYAAVPLVVAASADPLAWLARRLRSPGRAWLLGIASAALAGVLVVGGVRAAQIYYGYYQQDIRWGDGGPVSAFSWFFETQRETVAQTIAASDEVIYIPLAEANHPSFRYFTLRSHPYVATWATYFGAEGPLRLPAGRFMIAPWARGSAAFAAFMPNGTLVLLPRFDEATLAGFRAALDASDEQIVDPYGEIAAAVVDFPPDGGEIVLAQPIQHPVEVNYANQFRLVGWAGPLRLPQQRQGQVDVTLYLAPGPAIDRDVLIFTQLWTVSLERVASSQESVLLRWVYPPDHWEPGDIVPVPISQPVPEGLPPGAYYLAVGLRDYRARNLPVLGAEGSPVADAAIAGAMKVPRAQPISTAGMRGASAEFGGQIALIGYRITDEAGGPLDALSPGQPAVVTLYWRALRQPDADYTVFLHAVDPAGNLVAQSDLQPEGGQYPTGIWEPGEIVATTHPLTPPAESSGPYTLYAGWYSFPSLERLSVAQGGEVIADRRAVVVRGR